MNLEMAVIIINQPNITRNGPQRPSGTLSLLPITMDWNGNTIFISILFLESDKKDIMKDLKTDAAVHEKQLIFYLALLLQICLFERFKLERFSNTRFIGQDIQKMLA